MRVVSAFMSLLLAWPGVAVVSAQATRPAAEPELTPVLPGRPDGSPSVSSELLGEPYQSAALGISFRPPAGSKQIRKPVGEELVQFGIEERKWVLQVSRMDPAQLRLQSGAPRPLTSERDEATGELRYGLLEQHVDLMKLEAPALEVFRQDVINIGEYPAGIVAARYQIGVDTMLTQRAILQVGTNLVYLLNLTVPAPRDGTLESDPATKQAVETFTDLLDSVKLLDLSAVRDEQDQRLFTTRSLFVNMTEVRIKQALAKEQWLRIIRDGKDVGYSYVVEEVGRDLPRKAKVERQGGREGVVVGVRTRTYPDAGTMVDAESWAYSAFDRKTETWSSFAFTTDPKGEKTLTKETGSSTEREKPVKDPTVFGGQNPGVAVVTEAKLEVWRDVMPAEPFVQALPPWYTPQAIAHLLPRLCARHGEGRRYLFATYVSEQKKVMHRYVDVLPEREVTLLGKRFRAIPVEDRIGYEGSVTTHYVSRDGKYMGSTNPDSKITVVPSDSATLQKLWDKPDLSRPGDVKEENH